MVGVFTPHGTSLYPEILLFLKWICVKNSQITTLTLKNIMLIEFSVGNYRSFKEKVTFSMVAANITAKDKELDENNVYRVDKDLELIKSAAIYGANASGKSNLAKAIGFMRWFMVNSSKDTQSTDEINVERFRLNRETEGKPSFFEIVFLLDGKKYRYGFEATTEKVISEWLFYVPQSRETKLFKREGQKINSTKSYGEGIEQITKLTRDNALFLSVCAQFNVDIAEKILNWITKNLNIISGSDDNEYLRYTLNSLKEHKNKDEILQLVKKLDLSIHDIEVEETEISHDSLPESLRDILSQFNDDKEKITATSVQTKHKKFDEQGNYISDEIFNLGSEESEGTQKLFALAGPLFDVLKKGKILIIDEFDTKLHPLISRAIVEIFNSNQTNPNNAQLIFMTHDTNLLSNKLFRRDQIWFTEKNRVGATDLYSLVEYKVRNDASFESDYIKGRYGAIPYIGDLTNLIDSHA
jgi:uncharacterized protein